MSQQEAEIAEAVRHDMNHLREENARLTKANELLSARLDELRMVCWRADTSPMMAEASERKFRYDRILRRIVPTT